MNVFASRPDTHLAAKDGRPVMKTMRPPHPGERAGGGGSTAARGTVTGGSRRRRPPRMFRPRWDTNTAAVDARPDARQSSSGGRTAGATPLPPPIRLRAVPGAAGSGRVENSTPFSGRSGAGAAAGPASHQPPTAEGQEEEQEAVEAGTGADGEDEAAAGGAGPGCSDRLRRHARDNSSRPPQ